MTGGAPRLLPWRQVLFRPWIPAASPVPRIKAAPASLPAPSPRGKSQSRRAPRTRDNPEAPHSLSGRRSRPRPALSRPPSRRRLGADGRGLYRPAFPAVGPGSPRSRPVRRAVRRLEPKRLRHGGGSLALRRVPGAHRDTQFVIHSHNTEAAQMMVWSLYEAGYHAAYRPFAVDLVDWLSFEDAATPWWTRTRRETWQAFWAGRGGSWKRSGPVLVPENQALGVFPCVTEIFESKAFGCRIRGKAAETAGSALFYFL